MTGGSLVSCVPRNRSSALAKPPSPSLLQPASAVKIARTQSQRRVAFRVVIDDRSSLLQHGRCDVTQGAEVDTALERRREGLVALLVCRQPRYPGHFVVWDRRLCVPALRRVCPDTSMRTIDQ